MPRRARSGSGGLPFHVLNRGVRRSRLFDSEADYARFEQLLERARSRVPIRLLAFCLMPNHFHLVLWPEHDQQLSKFMHWLTAMHTRQWHAQHGSGGTGPVYQGRFKSFPIQNDRHFLRVCRYVERNALRAGLCQRAEDWRWSSLWHRCRSGDLFQLDPWPIPPTDAWVAHVNRDEGDLSRLRLCVRRGIPFGDDAWTQRTAHALQLASRLHGRGRPRAIGDGFN